MAGDVVVEWPLRMHTHPMDLQHGYLGDVKIRTGGGGAGRIQFNYETRELVVSPLGSQESTVYYDTWTREENRLLLLEKSNIRGEGGGRRRL